MSNIFNSSGLRATHSSLSGQCSGQWPRFRWFLHRNHAIPVLAFLQNRTAGLVQFSFAEQRRFFPENRLIPLNFTRVSPKFPGNGWCEMELCCPDGRRRVF